ncbi:uncharacterized protein [Drosophila pseudoobscura]|uniref:Uncharacterized protein isoform X1 n=2 Tax=Drosophila pseudoobscura pseudoobscura TaxID=46245 RepID=A0A6I8VA84_DROPS|nr:uncharacterized protein LOC13036320 isoform X1 [Drosophila pseudoobscura]
MSDQPAAAVRGNEAGQCQAMCEYVYICITLDDERMWNSNTTQLLLRMLLDRIQNFKNPMKKKREVWQSIVLEMAEHGYYDLTPEQLDRKFRNLKKTYEKIKRNNRFSKWEYFDKMDAILGNKPVVSQSKKRPNTEIVYLNEQPEDQNVEDDASNSASTSSKHFKTEPEQNWEYSPIADNSNMNDMEECSWSLSNCSIPKKSPSHGTTSNFSDIVNVLQDLVKQATEVKEKPPFKNMEVLTYWDFLLNDMPPAVARDARHKVTNLLQNYVSANQKKTS